MFRITLQRYSLFSKPPNNTKEIFLKKHERTFRSSQPTIIIFPPLSTTVENRNDGYAS